MDYTGVKKQSKAAIEGLQRHSPVNRILPGEIRVNYL